MNQLPRQSRRTFTVRLSLGAFVFSLSLSSFANPCRFLGLLGPGFTFAIDERLAGGGPRFTPQELSDARDLHSRSPSLRDSDLIRNALSLHSPTDPMHRLAAWLRLLEQAQTSPSLREQLRERFIDALVIKQGEIPESYFETQIRLGREQGRGNITLTRETRNQLADTLIADQKRTLETWFAYLTSRDVHAPTWVRAWALDGALRLGTLNPETHRFADRSNGTVNPFAELNREAVALAMGEATTSRQSFARLYAHHLSQLSTTTQNLSVTEGRWVRYPQGSSEQTLVQAIQGCNTGWCTRAPETARIQLRGGDFHVYFSNDAQGRPTVPRIAIRMEGSRIAEVRGIAANQHLDSSIASTNILRQQLANFGNEGESYQRRVDDMRLVTEIERKQQHGNPLTASDLRFLYEIDRRIEGFGYEADPRIAEIIARRNIRQDLAFSLGVRPDQISLSQDEALRGGIAYHHGDLDLSSLTSSQGLQLPQHIGGNLNLSGLTSSQGLQLPQHIGGNLDLRGLTSAQGLQLPQHIGGSLSLWNLTSAQGLQLPQHIGGYLGLSSLTSAQGLRLPQHIGGNLDLSGLTSARGLQLPQRIERDLYLSSLTSAQGLQLPQHIGGYLSLSGLTSARGLQLPQRIGGNLDLSGLTSSQELQLPQHIGGDLSLVGLTSAPGLQLPQRIERDLYLRDLTSAQGLQLPQHIGRHLYFNRLTSARGLQLPQHIGGDLILSKLFSAQGLQLPQHIGANLDLSGLTSAQGLQLPQHIGGSLYLSGLTSAQGLTIPDSFSGTLYVRNGLQLPAHFFSSRIRFRIN